MPLLYAYFAWRWCGLRRGLLRCWRRSNFINLLEAKPSKPAHTISPQPRPKNFIHSTNGINNIARPTPRAVSANTGMTISKAMTARSHSGWIQWSFNMYTLRDQRYLGLVLMGRVTLRSLSCHPCRAVTLPERLRYLLRFGSFLKSRPRGVEKTP